MGWSWAYLAVSVVWPGWVGLAITVVAWIGLLGLHRESHRSRTVVDQALVGIVGSPTTLPGEGRGDGQIQAEAEAEAEANGISANVTAAPAPASATPVASDDDLDSDTMWKAWRLVIPVARRGRSYETVRNVDYAGDGLKSHRLDIIRRRTDQPAAGPVMVYIHGGAWIIGDKREQGFPMLLELARRGWVCVTINYRLSPKATWPDHIVDCKMAIAWVREHIAEYGGDSGFIAVSGGSAGGHLSALVALTPGDRSFQPGFEDKDTSVDACVPVYGVYDMTCTSEPGAKRHVVVYNKGLLHLLERRVFKSRLDQDRDIFEAASPLYRVNADAPPFFVLHGMNDTLVPVTEARRFVKALRDASQSVVAYAELPRTQHAFDVLPSVRPANAVAGIVRFVEGVRKGQVVRGRGIGGPGIGSELLDLPKSVRPDVPSHPG